MRHASVVLLALVLAASGAFRGLVICQTANGAMSIERSEHVHVCHDCEYEHELACEDKRLDVSFGMEVTSLLPVLALFDEAAQDLMCAARQLSQVSEAQWRRRAQTPPPERPPAAIMAQHSAILLI